MIGIVALIFLGPRKLPQMARTIGKTMADFRNTTNEFKSTWEREVNFDEEEKALRTGEISKKPVPRDYSSNNAADALSAPEIKEIDKEKFDEMVSEKAGDRKTEIAMEAGEEIDNLSDKRSWL